MELPLITDFIAGSPLFDEKEAASNYSRLSKESFLNELHTYLNVQVEETARCAKENQSGLSTRLEANRNPEKQKRSLKNLALYVDRICLDDPLYLELFSGERPDIGIEGFMEPKGLLEQSPPSKADGVGLKTAVAKQVLAMMKYRRAVMAGQIRFLPFHRMQASAPSNEIAVATDILDWIKNQAKVHSVTFKDCGVMVGDEGLHDDSAGVHIDFKGYEGMSIGIRIVGERVFKGGPSGSQGISLKTDGRRKELEELLPSYIQEASEEMAVNFIFETVKARCLGLKYVANSDFTSELLKNLYNTKDTTIADDTSDYLMEIELPFLDQISLQELLLIRENEGEAFKNFRVELEAKLRDFGSIKEPEQLRIKLRNLAHELQDVQIRKIQSAVSTLKSNFKSDLILNAATLGVAMFVPGGQLATGALPLTIGKMTKSLYDQQTKIRENPCYFVWKLTPDGRSSRFV